MTWWPLKLIPCVWGGKGDCFKAHVCCINVSCNFYERKLANQKTNNARHSRKCVMIHDLKNVTIWELQTSSFLREKDKWIEKVPFECTLCTSQNSYSQVSFKNLDKHQGVTSIRRELKSKETLTINGKQNPRMKFSVKNDMQGTEIIQIVFFGQIVTQSFKFRYELMLFSSFFSLDLFSISKLRCLFLFC